MIATLGNAQPTTPKADLTPGGFSEAIATYHQRVQSADWTPHRPERPVVSGKSHELAHEAGDTSRGAEFAARVAFWSDSRPLEDEDLRAGDLSVVVDVRHLGDVRHPALALRVACLLHDQVDAGRDLTA